MGQETPNKIVSFNWDYVGHVLHDRKLRGNHPPLRTLAKSNADILAIEKKEMLDSLLVGGTPT